MGGWGLEIIVMADRQSVVPWSGIQLLKTHAKSSWGFSLTSSDNLPLKINMCSRDKYYVNTPRKIFQHLHTEAAIQYPGMLRAQHTKNALSLGGASICWGWRKGRTKSCFSCSGRKMKRDSLFCLKQSHVYCSITALNIVVCLSLETCPSSALVSGCKILLGSRIINTSHSHWVCHVQHITWHLVRA